MKEDFDECLDARTAEIAREAYVPVGAEGNAIRVEAGRAAREVRAAAVAAAAAAAGENVQNIVSQAQINVAQVECPAQAHVAQATAQVQQQAQAHVQGGDSKQMQMCSKSRLRRGRK